MRAYWRRCDDRPPCSDPQSGKSSVDRQRSSGLSGGHRKNRSKNSVTCVRVRPFKGQEVMSGKSDLDTDLRKKILARPNVILDDKDLMRALVGAKEEAMGGNIVDIRGIAMERLEHRLDRLEDTHRS